MNPLLTILTTAAVTAGSIRAYKIVRERLREAHANVKGVRKHRDGQQDGSVVDLEPDEKTGVYGVRTES